MNLSHPPVAAKGSQLWETKNTKITLEDIFNKNRRKLQNHQFCQRIDGEKVKCPIIDRNFFDFYDIRFKLISVMTFNLSYDIKIYLSFKRLGFSLNSKKIGTSEKLIV